MFLNMRFKEEIFLIALLHIVGPHASNIGLIPDAPGRPLVLEFTSRSANLSWAPPFNEAQVPINHYVIHVRRGEVGEWDQTIETDTNDTFYQVNNLSPFTTYSFRVSAVNSDGISPLSKVSYFMLTLREAPSGKPTITAAHNTSSTSLQLSWRPPPPTTINGEFLGYYITYRPRHSNSSHLISEAFIDDPEVSQFLIKGLIPFTQYLVGVQVRNPAGLGPPTKVVIMTDEGVPSQPLDVSFRNVTSQSVDVYWSLPEEPNGVITGYRLYFMSNNFTDVQTVQASSNHMQYTLGSLKPYETYTIWLRAFTWKHEGASSETFEVLTDVQGPDKPTITNVSCSNGKSLSLRWLMPNCRCKFVEFFVLHHIEKNGLITEDIIIENKKNTPLRYIEYIMNNLSTEFTHEFKVCGATRSIYNMSLVLYGEFSNTQQVFWPSQCDAGASFVSTADVYQEDYRRTSIIIAGSCALGAISFIILSIVLWRKCCMASYYFLTESPSSLETTISVVGSTSNSALVFAGSSIPVCSFTEYVSTMHSNQNSGFWQRFQTLSDKCSLSHSLIHCHSSKEVRTSTLRSSESTSCTDDGGDLSRFCMNTLSRKDSVLFSFIDGYNVSNAYIAAQGPLNINNELFWQFAWKQGVAAIVTISSQNMDIRCEYNSYSTLEVGLLHESVDTSFVVRVLQLTSKDKNLDFESRDILFFQLNMWPTDEESLPNSLHEIIRFIDMAALSKRELLGPVLVYSSCGPGPVGIYILCDAMLKQMEVQGRIDIDGYVSHIQRQSSFPLVQNCHQYIFAHDLLSHAVKARFLHAQ